ncbi:E3 SUMO-protein ligase SIZ1-like [Papaver somniferum]|uniref:E3 SUMO-protein ligase SIZ1-like n=1 Tax=Papaver somniferum TaxID=3469 RepID=UPI000E703602|nr:E3 SUMO-protein ligase SIZ1-like [Papaver somniferum]
MDLVLSCKEKLGCFRVKELKDVLTHLGLGNQGRKQELLERILAAITDEQVTKSKKNSIGREGIAKIIEATYRKMQASRATDLASKGQSDLSFDAAKFKDQVVDSRKIDIKVQCPCGSSLQTESMIQCEDPRCQVWQHIGCVILPDKPMERVPPIPPQFFCEICRIDRADPYTYPLPPIKLTALSIPTDETNPMQNVEKTFQLTRADRDMVQKPEYDVQAWCMLLNDKVIFRMHWPQILDLRVNGVPVRSINRLSSQLLGANGRDDGHAITTCTREGMNKISLTGCDARIFCLGIRIAKRRTVQQVLNLIPKELDGERFEHAHARVCRCIGGGIDAENADSDSDLEVVADSVTVNLRCPMSGSRTKTAGRFKPCIHMGCFDLETFVELNQRSRKWQCPICLKNYALEHMIIDPYFNRITAMMSRCGEDVTEIDVKPDGSWRAKNDREHLDLAQWHFPDGSLCVETGKNIKPDLENSKQIKHGPLEGQSPFKLRIKKNSNGTWEVKKPQLLTLSPESQLKEKYDIHSGGGILRSSSGTGSARDVDDRNANRDVGGHDFLANDGSELDSVSPNFDSAYEVPSAPVGNADIIILSDSDEEMENLISHGAVFETGQTNACGTSFSAPSLGGPVSYPEDPGPITDSALDLLNSNGTSTSNVVQDCIVKLKRTANSCADTLAKYARTKWSSPTTILADDFEKDHTFVIF